MGRRGEGDTLRLGRAWVWTADAERRWLRAFRLLATPEPGEPGDRRQEVDDGDDRGGLRAGLDGAAGGEPDDRAARRGAARLGGGARLGPRG